MPPVQIQFLTQEAHLVSFLQKVGPRVGVDLEGQLGRFGRANLVQVYSPALHTAALVDVKSNPRLLEPLSWLWKNEKICKIFHDCREDVALLKHRSFCDDLSKKSVFSGITNVFDTQVAYLALLQRRSVSPYLISLPELARVVDPRSYKLRRWDQLEKLSSSCKGSFFEAFEERPLTRDALRYATEGCVLLPKIASALRHELGDLDGSDMVVRRSERYLEYAELNEGKFESGDALAEWDRFTSTAIPISTEPSLPDGKRFFGKKKVEHRQNDEETGGLAANVKPWTPKRVKSYGHRARCFSSETCTAEDSSVINSSEPVDVFVDGFITRQSAEGSTFFSLNGMNGVADAGLEAHSVADVVGNLKVVGANANGLILRCDGRDPSYLSSTF